MRPFAFTMTTVWLALIGCDGEKPVQSKRPRPVRYDSVGSGEIGLAQAFASSVNARDATQLSFRVAGNLAKLPVRMGGSVKKGQLIGQLDDGDYRVALSQAQASWQSAKTQHEVARSAFRRSEKLYETGSVSLSEYENTKGQLRSAEAQLAASSQQVKQARNQLDYTRLLAPFDGIVNSVEAKQGELIGAGQPVAVVSRGGELEITVGVPEGLVPSIKVGTPAQVVVSALGNEPLAGKVREVGFASEGSTYPVRISLDTIPEDLRPGMAAMTRFSLGHRKAALTVPASAVGNTEAGSFVFRLNAGKDDTFVATKTTVKLGELTGARFEVKDGLKPGDKVATAGLSSLVDGMVVRLLEPAGGSGKSK